MQTLEPGEWLNGSIIDFALLDHHNNAPQQIKNVTKIVPTTFYQALKAKRKGQSDIWRTARKQINTDGQNVFEHKYILIPCNTGGHWILIIVWNLPQMNNQDATKKTQVLVLDSLNGEAGDQPVQEILQFLEMEWNKTHTSTEKKQFSELKIHFPTVPYQDNYFDCGLFLIAFAEQFLQSDLFPESIPQDLTLEYLIDAEDVRQHGRIYLHDRIRKLKTSMEK
ncbi:sentrin-specific protease 7-like [Glandiceps talaboti]